MCKGVIGVPQGCCEPVLQSSTEQWGSCSALTSAAVLWVYDMSQLT